MHESKHRPQEKVLKVLVEGESFGEIALIMECKRNCNVRSASFVELCLLSRSDFYDVLSQESYAEDKALMEGIIMFVMGQLFSPLALALNDWENHKLQTTYDNHLVFKNFVFEFVNNYFIMFYIAYLRQIKDPISGKVAPCPRSCMAELQLKMLFVFTGKTMGLKLGEYGIPWIKSFWKTREDQKRTTRHRQMTQLGADIGGMGKSSDGLNPANSGELGDMEAVGKRQDCAGDNLHDLDGTVLTDVEWLDKQYFLADFDGTFDDFSQMAIQFGFLALFAPACPIAPLLGPTC